MPTKHNLTMPPMLPAETLEQYTDRLTGADGGTPPYPEHRNRQCSIGYHDECTDTKGKCKCPCHYPTGANAEVICADLVQLLREGYEVHFMPIPDGAVSILARNTGGSVLISESTRSVEWLVDLMNCVYSQMPEVKDAD